MARPSKYNWEAIEIAYEGGLDNNSIVKRFGITKKQLTNKAALKGWVIKGYIKSDIEGISASLGSLNEISTKHPELESLIVAKIDTTMQDNELIENNRKLSKLAQGIIIKHKDNFDHSNIKNLTGALKDIESIANPQASKTDILINNTNAMQNITQIKTIDDIYKD